MMRLGSRLLPLSALALLALALLLAGGAGGVAAKWTAALAIAVGGLGALSIHPAGLVALLVGPHVAAAALLVLLNQAGGNVGSAFFALAAAAWLLAWSLAERLSALRPANPSAARLIGGLAPLLFGLWLLLIWEFAVRGLGVPSVLLPAPSAIWARLYRFTPNACRRFPPDFHRRAYRLWDRLPLRILRRHPRRPGGFPAPRIAADRQSRFRAAHRRHRAHHGDVVRLRWPSKAAVVVVMTFFPCW
jgi:NitT/TauT family transport system permease protein